MTEQEYVDATNLTKLRSALSIMKEIIWMRRDSKNKKSFSEATRKLYKILDHLSEKVEGLK